MLVKVSLASSLAQTQFDTDSSSSSASSSSQSPGGAQNLAESGTNSQWSEQAFDPLETLGGIPGVGSLSGLAGSLLPEGGQSPFDSLPSSLDGLVGSLPISGIPNIGGSLPQLPGPLPGLVGSLPLPQRPQFPSPQAGFPSQYLPPGSPAIPSNPERGTPLAKLIGWTSDGRPIFNIGGEIRVQAPQVPNVAGGRLSAESVPASAPSPPGPPSSPHVTPPSPLSSLPSSPASTPSPPASPPSPPVSHAPGPSMAPSAVRSALPSPSAPVSPPAAPPSDRYSAKAVPTSTPPLLGPTVQEAPGGVLEFGQEETTGTPAASSGSHPVGATTTGTASAAHGSSSAAA